MFGAVVLIGLALVFFLKAPILECPETSHYPRSNWPCIYCNETRRVSWITKRRYRHESGIVHRDGRGWNIDALPATAPAR